MTPDLQSGAFATQPRMQKEISCVKKQMKAERWAKEDTLRGTLLLRMATFGTLAKHRRCHPEGSLPSSKDSTRKHAWSFSQIRYFDCQKTKRAGFKPPREAARSKQFSRFFFEIWERESAPAELMPDITAIFGRLLSASAVKSIGE